MTGAPLELALLFGASPVALADDIDDALAAYERRDYTTAFAKLMQAAEQGNVEAQSFVGQMYSHGHGAERRTISTALL